MKTVLAMGDGPRAWPPEALVDPGDRSIFMDMYAAQARFHMKTFGTTPAAKSRRSPPKNHNHSQFNPLAQYRFSHDRR